MNIKIGKYTITSDSLNFIITETDKLRERKDGSKIEGRGSKFFVKISDALNHIVDQRIKESDAVTIRDLQKDFYRNQEWVKDQFKEI